MPVVSIQQQHRPVIDHYILEEWAGPMVISKGSLCDSRTLPGFVFEEEGAVKGALLYQLRAGEMEIVILFSLEENRGVGWALIQAAMDLARERGLPRMWLITTNDNTRAIRYYQMRGFSLKAVHIGAMIEARKKKPQIPPTGNDGIPILHEVEFEILL